MHKKLLILILTTINIFCDGELDPSFGTNGQVITFFPGNATSQIPRNIRIQYDGKILVGGRNNQVGGPCCFINRYNTDGSLDTTFGTDGEVVACFPSGTFYASDMVIQPDGKIIVGLISPVGGNDTVVLARFLTNGTLDASFGINGFAQATVTAGGAARELLALAIQKDGKIVITSSTSTTSSGIVGRFLSNGSVDTTFGSNGFVIVNPVNYGGSSLSLYGIQIQHDGKIVVFGDMSTVFVLNSDNSIGYAADPNVFFVARLLSNGNFDPNFGTNGVATTNAGTGSAGGLVQSDGKILAYGSTNTPPFVIVRYLPDGTLDQTFANAGIGTYSLAGNIDNMNCIAIQSDGKIVASSSFDIDANPANLTFTTLRINTDGTLDNSFGTNGYVNTFVLGQPNCQTFACVIDTNGQIYVTGTVGNTKVGLVKYKVDSIIYGPLSKALAYRYYNQNN